VNGQASGVQLPPYFQAAFPGTDATIGGQSLFIIGLTAAGLYRESSRSTSSGLKIVATDQTERTTCQFSSLS
jgi:hypothetical protein